MIEPLSTQEMLEHLRFATLDVRAEIAKLALYAKSQPSLQRGKVETVDTGSMTANIAKRMKDHIKEAQTLETLAAILEVQDYKGFRHARKAQGIFTIRLVLPNGKGGTLAEFRDANPVAAWLNAYEAIKGRESAVTPKGDEIV